MSYAPEMIGTQNKVVVEYWRERAGALEKEVAFMHDCNTRQKGIIVKLEEAIRTVLADEESVEGGWGPDVTMVAVLKEALDGADHQG